MLTTLPSPTEIEDLEVDLLLEAVYRRWGYDFRSYSRASISRRLRDFAAESGHANISELISHIIRDQALVRDLARQFSVTVTDLFRDPQFYRALREIVLPRLRTWPRFKVWHAGCATGEEVYSLAILLTEEGLYERATMYATDFNEDALRRAREGIVHSDRIQQATRNYQATGGKRSFSDYYRARYGVAIMDQALKTRLVFANHNLASDSVFGEMQLVVCRNVLIYFNKELKNRVLRLLAESLSHGGFLCVGTKETLEFTAVADQFQLLDAEARIYKKRGDH